MPLKKKIIVIGWTLIGVLVVTLLIIAMMGVLQGEGARPWKLVRGGRGGMVFPVILLPLFLAAAVIGVLWIRRRFFSSKREDSKHGTNNSENENRSI